MDGKYLIIATCDHRTINNACDRSMYYELISPSSFLSNILKWKLFYD